MSTTEKTTLDRDEGQFFLGLAALLCGVAILILVVDWKIKNDIVKLATEAKAEIDRWERKYYGEGAAKIAEVVVHSFAHSDDNPPSGNPSVDGVAGLEERADSADDPGPARQAARERNRADARARIHSVDVPKGD